MMEGNLTLFNAYRKSLCQKKSNSKNTSDLPAELWTEDCYGTDQKQQNPLKYANKGSVMTLFALS